MEKPRKKVHEDAILLKKDDTDHWLSLKFEAMLAILQCPIELCLKFFYFTSLLVRA